MAWTLWRAALDGTVWCRLRAEADAVLGPPHRPCPDPAGPGALAIARLAQRLECTTARAEVPRPVGMVVNRPEGGVPMRVRGRA